MSAAGERLVIGMGSSGLSLASHWYGDCALTVVDDRHAPPNRAVFEKRLPKVRVRAGENFRAWTAAQFEAYERIGLSPGIAPSVIAAPAGRVTNDAVCFTEAWRNEAPATSRLLAVTGTNGKSTVTALAAHLAASSGLSAAAVGNIGEPMLEALLQWRAGSFPDVVVVELSSFQLEIARMFNSDAAVLLNVGNDHLDRHGDKEHYAKIKRTIYNRTKRAIANTQAGKNGLPLTMVPYSSVRLGKDGEWVAASGMPLVKFASGAGRKGHWTIRRGWMCRAGQPYYLLSAMSLACRRYPELTLATLALTECLNLPPAYVAAGLASFEGLPHRREVVGNRDGVVYVDDSKATNVEAALFALTHVGGNVVWIGGGDGKGQRFDTLVTAAGVMRAAVLMGEDAESIAGVLEPAGVPCSQAADMNEAVRLARSLAQPGDTVLLSPACSSLDMFSSYHARGLAFARAVREGGSDAA